jgi:hypothetical protein
MTHFAIGFDCTVRDRAVDALFESLSFWKMHSEKAVLLKWIF